MGASLDDVQAGGWLLGPFRGDLTWQTWSVLSLSDADWLAVARSWAPIIAALVLVGPVSLLHLGAIETTLDRDLDTDRELRDAGIANVASGLLGGIPGGHSVGSSSTAARRKVDARVVGLIAAGVPLLLLLFGATVLAWLPRVVVGGILAFVGLSFIVEWVWDRRGSLSRIEYGTVVVILAVVVLWGFVTGFVVGLALAVVLFAVSYGRIDLVHEVGFGQTYRSTVDRPPSERELLLGLADRVQILRVSGHVFFGSTDRLLGRIRARARDGTPPRYLVLDLQRVTGVDASAIAALVKAERLVAAHGSEIVLAGASDAVRARLVRGGVLGDRGLVTFEPDLDRGLQRCEEGLLQGADGAEAPSDGMPAGLAAHLDRVEVAEGGFVFRQDDPPDGVAVLAEGRLAVEATTPGGRRVRLRTLRPGVVVGEIAWYSGDRRTADVVAETPCVVLRCSSERIARIESEDPRLAAELHRWLAATLADRLSASLRTLDALLD
jgi:SulP family sulfate permease